MFEIEIRGQWQQSDNALGCMDEVFSFRPLMWCKISCWWPTFAIFLSCRAPVPWMMWAQQDIGAKPAWEELTIHRIMAITAFPSHWSPSRDTHTREDPLLYLDKGATLPSPPSFILQRQFKEANEHRPGISILQEGRSHSSTGLSVKSHTFTEGQA